MAVKTRAQAAVRAPSAPRLDGHVVICGADELAFLIAEELQRLGDAVAVVAANDTGKFMQRARALGIKTIAGDYRDEDILGDAGVARARAFIAAENDDVGNLHAALAAHELNPQLRIVLRVFNPEMGAHIQRVIEGAEVLSSSAIAAPSLVSAALQTDFEQRVEVGGRVFVVRHAAADDPDLVMPLAVQTHDGTALFPDPIDNAICLADGGESATFKKPSRRSGKRRGLIPAEVRAFGQALAAVADSRLRYMVAVLVVLVLISAVVFQFGLGLNFLDAVYYTTTTITTIGYGDISPLKASWLVKLYVIVLELLGATTLAIFFALVTDALIGVRLRRALGGGLHHDVSEHLVVCGLGNMGHRIVRHIHNIGMPVVGLELDEALPAVQDARRMNVPVVIGDARRPESLQAVKIDEARCLLVTTEDDLANLEIALNARSLNGDLWIVVRLRDPDLAARVQRAIGHGVSRSTAALAAPGFVTATFGHRVVSAIPVGEQMLVIAQVSVAAGSRFEKRNVSQLTDDVYGRVLMLGRGDDQTWTPDAQTDLAAGDDLLVVATRRGLGELVRRTSATGKELTV
jgi:Trk K+ transport system NAD-binding subunit